MANWWDSYPDADATELEAFFALSQEKPKTRGQQKLASEVGDARTQLAGISQPGFFTGALGVADDMLAANVGLGTNLAGMAARFSGAPAALIQQAAGGRNPELIADDLHRTGQAYRIAQAERDAPGWAGKVSSAVRGVYESLPTTIV